MFRSIHRLGLVGLVAAVLILSAFLWLTDSAAGPETPSTPILLIVNDASPYPFGRYLGEILRAEGLNSFDVIDIGSLTNLTLTQHDVAILAYTSLTSNQAATLTDYVASGGRLIAMRPDGQIASMFGLITPSGTLTDGYLQISQTTAFNGAAPGQGLYTTTLQIHGQADRYATQLGTVTIAQLYSTSVTATNHPAVVAANHGAGQAVAFTYDLAQNVAYTRQGNPANASIDIDNDGVTRTVDLFQATGGGVPWVDRDRIPVPQADEQQRLLARLVQQLVSGVRPLPQLWYFPDAAKTMLILTGDAHANPTSYYQQELDSINARGGKITLYISAAGDPTDATMQTWRAQGHEFGIHPYAFVSGSINNLAEGYAASDSWFSSAFSSGKSRTVRNHQVAWQGWTDAAEIEASYGISLSTDFYHWGVWLQKPDGTWPHGYVTGSGQSMKFVRADGTILPIYQQLTQLVDEHLIIGPGTERENLSDVQGFLVSKKLIDASLAGDYAALMTQFHVDYYNFGDPQIWAEMTMDYANSHGIPVWNADRWLNFVETRHDANYTNVAWDNINSTLTFSLTSVATSGITLTTIVPLQYNEHNLKSVTVDGIVRPFTVQNIKGVNVAFVSVPAGNHSFLAEYEAGGSGRVTQTTGANFGNCATLTNTHVISTEGGAVVLAAQFADSFDGTSLDTGRWSSGYWSSGDVYSPIMNGSVITIYDSTFGAWIRSTSTYTYGVLEFTAEFGAGENQHIGLADIDFLDQFFIFSTRHSYGYYDGHLYARAKNNAGEQFQDMGVIPSGMHQYRLEWHSIDADSDTVQFYIDDALGAEFGISWAFPPEQKPTDLNIWVSNNGTVANTPAPLRLDAIQITPYYPGGTYASCTFDAGTDSVWQAILWDAATPVSTSLTVETRSSADASTWTSWTPAIASGSTISPMQRYAQYRLLLDTANPNTTPQVNWVMLTSIHPGQTFTWTGNTSTAWDVGDNWSSNQVPASYDDAVIPGAAVTNWPTANVITAVHNLTLEAGAQLTVANPIAVSGVVSNSGGMYQTRPITDAGVPVEFLRLQDGSGNDKYYGVIITPTADLGNVTVLVRGNDDCGTGGVLRCYDITPQTTADADIQFFYRQAEAHGNIAPNAYHWISGWTPFASTRGNNGNEAYWVRATVNEYSPFVLKDTSPTAITLSRRNASSGASPAVIWLMAALVSAGVVGMVIKRRTQ